MIKPYQLFVVVPHSALLYFDENMNLYQADGKCCTDSLKTAILGHPDIVRLVGASTRAMLEKARQMEEA